MSSFSTGGVKKQRRKTADPPKVIALDDGTRKWSDQQQAIFEWAKNPKGNLLVRARAGTGKTTTIIEMMRHLPSSSILLCAFNKRIAEELTSRVPAESGAHVNTLHSLGYRLVRRIWQAALDDKRGLKLAEQGIRDVGLPNWRELNWAAKELASITKRVSPFSETPRDIEQVMQLGLAFNCFDGVEDNKYEPVTRAALRALEFAASQNDGTIDYDDMLYVPLRRGLTKGEYEFVIVDEAQDMNRAQLELAQRILKKGGHLIVVGDDRQAIYGFNGADKGSIDRLKLAYAAKELGLTTTYRCPSKVVALAQRMVPDFKAAPSALEGTIRTMRGGQHLREAQPGDFILSRLNAPLLATCLELIGLGKKAKVEGRDIGRRLVALIRKSNAVSIKQALSWMENWAQKQVLKAQKRDEQDRAVEALDIQQAIQFLAEACDTDMVSELTGKIESLFSDDGVKADTITCSTVHKAKGLEAKRVFILADTFKGEWAGEGEEANLKYVAVTRAMSELVFVDPPWKGEDEK
jgi:DNA helicase-2/ATP-dependent DNA helicase PcrA